MPLSTPSTFTLPEAQVDKSQLVADGDAMLLLKKDGSVMPLTIGIDIDYARHLMTVVGTRPLTPAEQAILEQGRRLFALLLAASTPAIMTILYELSENPEVFDSEKLAHMARGGH